MSTTAEAAPDPRQIVSEKEAEMNNQQSDLHLSDEMEEKAEKNNEQSEPPLSDDMKNETEPEQQPAKDVNEDENPQFLSGMQGVILMAPCALIMFLVLLDISIIVTAIPWITNEFHSLKDVGWYGSAYQLASAALQPLTGKMFANFKIKWTYLVFFAIFELGSLLCGVATSSKTLIVGRAVAGIGSSGLQNGAFTIIATVFEKKKQPAMMGFAIATAQIGILIGPLLGGAFTQYTTWRWCFYINLPVGGLAALLLIFSRIPEQVHKEPFFTVLADLPKRLDLVGFAIFAPAAIQVLLALQYGGNQFAWNSATIIGLFCGGGVNFLLFFVWDYYKGNDAMLPWPMFRKKAVWSSCLFYGLFMSSLVLGAYYLPIYFQGVKGATPTLSGAYLLAALGPQVFTAMLAGVSVGKIGYYLPFALASTVLGAIANGLLSTLTPPTSTGKWVGFLILIGFSRGLGMQMPITAVQNNLPVAEIPIVMALMVFFQSFFVSVFLACADTIFNNSLSSLLPKYAPNANAAAVIEAGATEFRKIVTKSELVGVLVAYAKSVDRVFYMAAAEMVACFAVAWAMGMKDIRQKKQVTAA